MGNQDGYLSIVTDEQIESFKKWSVKEILEWLHETNRLVNTFQTEEEKSRKFIFKGAKYGIYTPLYKTKNKQP
ncbi:MAG: hypothetical protein JKY53_05330 [Flavobacteriales bacterium]|nr:hypothetical protein [Flavobacteriales bacterium]